MTSTIYCFKRVGLEAGPLSQWLYSVLAEAGLPVICVAEGTAPGRAEARRAAARDATPARCRQLSTNGLESSTTRSAFGYQPCAAWVSSCR